MSGDAHDWYCEGGAGGWEVWVCSRCGRSAIPSVFGFLWPDVGRRLHRRWACFPAASVSEKDERTHE